MTTSPSAHFEKVTLFLSKESTKHKKTECLGPE